MIGICDNSACDRKRSGKNGRGGPTPDENLFRKEAVAKINKEWREDIVDADIFYRLAFTIKTN